MKDSGGLCLKNKNDIFPEKKSGSIEEFEGGAVEYLTGLFILESEGMSEEWRRNVPILKENPDLYIVIKLMRLNEVMGKRSGSKTEVRREQKSGFMQRKRITDALRMSANQLK